MQDQHPEQQSLAFGAVPDDVVRDAVESSGGLLLSPADAVAALTALRVAGGGTDRDAENARTLRVRLLSALGLQEAADIAPPELPLAVRPLSPSQRQVLTLVAEGMNNREVAACLSMALETVKTHMREVLRRLDAKSRTEAVLKANSYGMLTMRSEPPAS